MFIGDKNEIRLKAAILKAFPNFSEEDAENYFAEGYRRDDAVRRARAYSQLSASQPHQPVMYRDRPPGMKFEEFMRREYRDKGLLTSDFTLGELRARDEELANAYGKQLQRKEIPEDIRVVKAHRKTNKRERSQPQ